MQTCSRCNASSPDDAINCVNCDASLHEFSATTAALKNYKTNPRVKAVRITSGDDACPHCFQLRNTYPKNKVPHLPLEGCSHENGCRCFYEPVLSETAIVGRIAE